MLCLSNKSVGSVRECTWLSLEEKSCGKIFTWRVFPEMDYVLIEMKQESIGYVNSW